MNSKLEVWSRLAAVAVSCCFVLNSVWTANAQELRQVFDPPFWGTFYLLSAQTQEIPSPPYPYDPYGGTLPVYEMAGFTGTYLVADSPEDFAALVAATSGGGEMETMDEGA